MIDREDIISGLQFTASMLTFDPLNGEAIELKDLNEHNKLTYDACMGAIELLKAQEPRVMTLEELDAIYQTKECHTWPFNTPPYLWMTVNPDARWIRGFWIYWGDLMYSLENNTAFYVRENYGKVWKIWTAEPTDEQIKAVKWE